MPTRSAAGFGVVTLTIVGLLAAAGPVAASPPTTTGAATTPAPPYCDPVDARLCLLPFPSNAFTRPDETSATGLRVAFPAEGAPVNASGVAVDLSEWNRNDGFSANTTLLTQIPGLDAGASKLPTWTDFDASLADASPVLLLDLATGERVPLWAELDARAADRRQDQLLEIHPAVPLEPGHTYVAALRDLVDTDGRPIEASADFASIRDGLTPTDSVLAGRASALAPAFDTLSTAGVDVGALVVAWDFTVASTENTTGRMLHIRDETLTQLGDTAPPFTIDDSVDDPTNDDGTPVPGLARRITGTFTVTNWLTGDASPGNGFDYGDVDVAADPDALPVVNGTLTATFQCNVPTALMDGDEPGHVIQYGHGLLGSEAQIDADHQIDLATMSGSIVCATKWAGMSEDDIPNAVTSLTDFSNFPTLTDRLQQGVLNQLVLTRLLLADDGLVADPAFARPDGRAVFDNSTVAYNGNSQGGIMGLMLAGVSTDIDRFVFGVAGMNYGVLLPRSVDFDTYEQILDPAYPYVVDRTLLVAMIQMLWDRGEGAGYVTHVTADPLPGTPPKTVLVHVAFGDWQVSEITAMIAARAMDLPIHRPVTADGRSGEVEPGWGLETLTYPSDGGGIVVWDSGSNPSRSACWNSPLSGVTPSRRL